MSDNPTPLPRRGLPRWFGLLIVVLIAAGWFGWRSFERNRIPAVRLDGIDPAIIEAVQTARSELESQPRSARACGEMGMVLLANKLEADALVFLGRAAELDPQDPRWPYLQGIALLGHNPDEAIPHFRRAAEVCRKAEHRSAIHLRLAETLIANGHLDEAESVFAKVSDPDLAACVSLGRANLAIAKDDLNAARTALRDALMSPWTRKRANDQMVAIAKQLGEAFTPAANLPADAPWPDPIVNECLKYSTGKEARNQRITLLEQQGRFDQALEQQRRLVNDYPDAPTLLALGIMLGRRGLFDESAMTLERCLQLEPDIVRAHYYLSLARFGQAERLQQQGQSAAAERRFQESAAQAKQATQRTPHHGESHLQLGLALYRLQRPTDAIAAFRQAVATRPDLGDAHYWLAKALWGDGQRAEALIHARDALRYTASDDPRPRELLQQIEAAPPTP